MFFAVRLTDEMCLALFTVANIVRDPQRLESLSRCKQDWKLRRTWVQVLLNEFCNCDNDYTNFKLKKTFKVLVFKNDHSNNVKFDARKVLAKIPVQMTAQMKYISNFHHITISSLALVVNKNGYIHDKKKGVTKTWTPPSLSKSKK